MYFIIKYLLWFNLIYVFLNLNLKIRLNSLNFVAQKYSNNR